MIRRHAHAELRCDDWQVWDPDDLEEGEEPEDDGGMLALIRRRARDELRARAVERPEVRRVRANAWVTASGERREAEGRRASRCTRHGHQPHAIRNLYAYLLSEVMGWKDEEIARELGLNSRQAARQARLRGRRLVPAGRPEGDPPAGTPAILSGHFPPPTPAAPPPSKASHI